jgi:hypothetical protein
MNPLIEKWVKYDEQFLATTQCIKNGIIYFPYVDQCSEIILSIQYIDFNKFTYENESNNCTVVVHNKLERILPENALNIAYSNESNVEKIICRSGTNSIMTYSEPFGQSGRLNLLRAAKNQNNKCLRKVSLNYNLSSLMRLLQIKGNFRDFFYEPLLYHVYSELNRNQCFLPKLIKFAKEVRGDAVRSPDKTLLMTNIKLYVRKWIVKSIDDPTSYQNYSKCLQNNFLTTFSRKMLACPRVLQFQLPLQMSNNLHILLNHHCFNTNNEVLPPFMAKMMSKITFPSQYYCFHYVTHLKCILPIAIHPISSMTFFYEDVISK